MTMIDRIRRVLGMRPRHQVTDVRTPKPPPIGGWRPADAPPVARRPRPAPAPLPDPWPVPKPNRPASYRPSVRNRHDTDWSPSTDDLAFGWSPSDPGGSLAGDSDSSGRPAGFGDSRSTSDDSPMGPDQGSSDSD